MFMPFAFGRLHSATGAAAIVAAFVLGYVAEARRRSDRSPTPHADVATPVRPDVTAQSHLGEQTRACRAALERFGEHPGSEGTFDEIAAAVLRWAAIDPQGALEAVRHRYDDRHRSVLLAQILATWAREAPAAAWEWIKRELPDDYMQYDAVLTEVGKRDPGLAWQFAAGVAAERDADRAQNIFVSALRGVVYSGRYDEARRLIATIELPGKEQEYDASSFLAGEWARFAPADAAKWALTLPEDSPARRQALTSLGVAWAQTDPAAAADFAASLPAGVDRENMLATALDTWVGEHPAEAGEWLLQHKQHPDFDQVLRSLATSSKIVETAPAMAIAWADTILSDEIRLQTMKIVMQKWAEKSPDAAKEFLQTHDFTAEMRDELRKELEARLGK